MIVIEDVSEDPQSDQRHVCEVRVAGRVRGRFRHNHSDTLGVLMIHAAAAVLIFALDQRPRRRRILRWLIRFSDSLGKLVAHV